MSFLDQHDLANDPVFISRCQMAAVKVCISIAKEDPGTPNHTNRATTASGALREPERLGTIMAQGVATTGLKIEATDEEIEAQIVAIFDAYAGVIDPAVAADKVIV